MDIKRTNENSLPREVFDHPKMGFSIPLHKFLTMSLKNLRVQSFEKHTH